MLRIEAIVADEQKFNEMYTHAFTLRDDLIALCKSDFADLEDPQAYMKLPEFHALSNSGMKNAEATEIDLELRRAMLYVIDAFLDELGL